MPNEALNENAQMPAAISGPFPQKIILGKLHNHPKLLTLTVVEMYGY